MAEATLPFTTPIAKSDFFDTTNFRNTLHACNIAIHNHFAQLVFTNKEGNPELNRLIYSSSDFAFRNRSRQLKGSQNLDLPFMNYRISPGGFRNETDRPWWNHIANIRGEWISELGRNIRWSPVTIEYDSTLFVHKDIDAMYAISEIFWDDSNETQLQPKVVIDDKEFPIPGILGYSLNPYSQYAEEDWLNENKIIAHQINMSLQTFIIKDNSSISIPKNIILNFGHGLGIPGETEDEVYTATVDHLNETVNWDL